MTAACAPWPVYLVQLDGVIRLFVVLAVVGATSGAAAGRAIHGRRARGWVPLGAGALRQTVGSLWLGGLVGAAWGAVSLLAALGALALRAHPPLSMPTAYDLGGLVYELAIGAFVGAVQFGLCTVVVGRGPPTRARMVGAALLGLLLAPFIGVVALIWVTMLFGLTLGWV